MKNRKILLTEKEIPEKWYNIVHDMPNKPLPPLHPGTREPIGPAALDLARAEGLDAHGLSVALRLNAPWKA